MRFKTLLNLDVGLMGHTRALALVFSLVKTHHYGNSCSLVASGDTVNSDFGSVFEMQRVGSIDWMPYVCISVRSLPGTGRVVPTDSVTNGELGMSR